MTPKHKWTMTRRQHQHQDGIRSLIIRPIFIMPTMQTVSNVLVFVFHIVKLTFFVRYPIFITHWYNCFRNLSRSGSQGGMEKFARRNASVIFGNRWIRLKSKTGARRYQTTTIKFSSTWFKPFKYNPIDAFNKHHLA